jgi:hypothetical protein
MNSGSCGDADIYDRIQNPLAGFSTGELMADVEDFANEYQLTDILPELKKGALVARDPASFQSLTELDEEEKAVLTREVTHKWSQTRTLYLTVITCSIGAAVQGWDQTGSNGANLSFPKAFGIGNGNSKSRSAQSICLDLAYSNIHLVFGARETLGERCLCCRDSFHRLTSESHPGRIRSSCVGEDALRLLSRSMLTSQTSSGCSKPRQRQLACRYG